jgi:hypothetical protein
MLLQLLNKLPHAALSSISSFKSADSHPGCYVPSAGDPVFRLVRILHDLRASYPIANGAWQQGSRHGPLNGNWKIQREEELILDPTEFRSIYIDILTPSWAIAADVAA